VYCFDLITACYGRFTNFISVCLVMYQKIEIHGLVLTIFLSGVFSMLFGFRFHISEEELWLLTLNLLRFKLWD
jgi:hypothetical protein